MLLKVAPPKPISNERDEDQSDEGAWSHRTGEYEKGR